MRGVIVQFTQQLLLFLSKGRRGTHDQKNGLPCFLQRHWIQTIRVSSLGQGGICMQTYSNILFDAKLWLCSQMAYCMYARWRPCSTHDFPVYKPGNAVKTWELNATERRWSKALKSNGRGKQDCAVTSTWHARASQLHDRIKGDTVLHLRGRNRVSDINR